MQMRTAHTVVRETKWRASTNQLKEETGWFETFGLENGIARTCESHCATLGINPVEFDKAKLN